jgi:hypothetical protein
MLLRQDRAPTAIAVVLEVAFRQAGGPVSGGEIAERTTAAARHRAVAADAVPARLCEKAAGAPLNFAI